MAGGERDFGGYFSPVHSLTMIYVIVCRDVAWRGVASPRDLHRYLACTVF